MRIIFLGPPGSGKGTQGDLVQQRYGFPKISMGDLLRRAVKERTLFGLKAKDFMSRGELVSDDIVIGMVQERIAQEDCREGYLLDGFPRNISQARHLEAMDSDSGEITIDICLKDEVLIERLSARRICSGCGAITNLRFAAENDMVCPECGSPLIQRDDDHPDVIRERLQVYHQQTVPLIDYYREKGHYHEVEGARSIEDVAGDIRAILDKVLKSE